MLLHFVIVVCDSQNDTILLIRVNKLNGETLSLATQIKMISNCRSNCSIAPCGACIWCWTLVYIVHTVGDAIKAAKSQRIIYIIKSQKTINNQFNEIKVRPNRVWRDLQLVSLTANWELNWITHTHIRPLYRPTDRRPYALALERKRGSRCTYRIEGWNWILFIALTRVSQSVFVVRCHRRRRRRLKTWIRMHGGTYGLMLCVCVLAIVLHRRRH